MKKAAAAAALFLLLPLAAHANDRDRNAAGDSVTSIPAAHATGGQSNERFLTAIQRRLGKWAHDLHPKKLTAGRCRP